MVTSGDSSSDSPSVAPTVDRRSRVRKNQVEPLDKAGEKIAKPAALESAPTAVATGLDFLGGGVAAAATSVSGLDTVFGGIKKAGSVVSRVLNAGTRAAAAGITHFGTALPDLGHAKNVMTAAGAVASPVALGSSLLGAVPGVRNLLFGAERHQEKGVMGAQVASDLVGGLATAASGATQGVAAGVTKLAPAASALGAVAGPAAIVGGALGVLQGGAQTLIAHKRKAKLKQYQSGSGQKEHSGVARLVAQAQDTRRMSGIGKVVAGALTLAGGAAVTAGALPIGAGLLGAGAAAMGAVGAYKQYRRHQIGNQLATSEEKERMKKSGLKLTDLEPQSRWQKFTNFVTANTRGVRRHEAMREHVGGLMAENAFPEPRQRRNSTLDDISSLAGLQRPDPNVPPTQKAKKEYARSAARVLDG
jgi:hypothetical protein